MRRNLFVSIVALSVARSALGGHTQAGKDAAAFQPFLPAEAYKVLTDA